MNGEERTGKESKEKERKTTERKCLGRGGEERKRNERKERWKREQRTEWSSKERKEEDTHRLNHSPSTNTPTMHAFLLSTCGSFYWTDNRRNLMSTRVT